MEQVQVATLKGDTFYAMVKVRCGKTVSEVDARPSDALALAVLTDSPIFVAEEVLERARAAIPQPAKASSTRNGVDSILEEITEAQYRMQAQQSHPMSLEEFTRAKDEVIAAVFGS